MCCSNLSVAFKSFKCVVLCVRVVSDMCVVAVGSSNSLCILQFAFSSGVGPPEHESLRFECHPHAQAVTLGSLPSHTKHDRRSGTGPPEHESLHPKTLENVTHMPKQCLWAASRAAPNMIAVQVWGLWNMSPRIPKPWKTPPTCPSGVFGRSPEPRR